MFFLLLLELPAKFSQPRNGNLAKLKIAPSFYRSYFHADVFSRISIQVHETRNIRDRKRLLKTMLRKEGSSETEGDSDHHASGNGHAIFKEKDIR